MSEIEFDLVLDAKGLMCPEPVMMLHTKVKELQPGGVLQVLATDPSTKRDIAKFCSFLGYNLLSHEEVEGVFTFYIEKP
jgi:tRNA 2-thiouridine synthesizing protein A